MIDRTRARAIAEKEIRARGLGSGMAGVFLVEEIRGRTPLLYGGPALEECWIAYATRLPPALTAFSILLINRETGDVVYAGSAHDEG